MSDPKQISLLLAEWDEQRARGREISLEELCRDSPEILPALKRNVEAIIAMEEKYPESAATRAGRTADDTADDGCFTSPASAGRYTLRAEIARGGMGVVVRAVDPAFDRDLAVKVMLADPRRRPELVRRFQEEARITGRLQHPGIPPVHDQGHLEDGRPFFSMKLIEGRTLEDLLTERENTGDVSRLIGIFEQVCQTLAYAHSRGVIHRDLKPANVMVGAFGEVQVMDWGLAKHLGFRESDAGDWESDAGDRKSTCETDGITQSGAALGTLRFMPPEQARGEIERLNEQSDVFGLGALLCTVLTGRPPFASASAASNLRAAIEGDLTEAFDRLDRCGADAEIVKLAKKCLAAEQSDRPQHAGEVAQAVSTYLEGVQEKLRLAEVERAEAQVKAVEEKRRRKWTLAAAAAVVLLLVGGVAGAFWYQETRNQESLRQTREIADSLSTMKQARERAEVLTEDLPLRRQHLDTAQKEKTHLEQALARLRAGEYYGVLQQFEMESAQLDQAEADHRLLTAYEHLDNQRVIFDTRQTRRQFEKDLDEFLKALNDYCDLNSSAEEGAAFVRSRPRAMQRRLRHVLHVCFAESCQSKRPIAERLRAVLDLVDGDSAWRRNVRKAILTDDVDRLAELARQTEESLRDATVLYLVSQRLVPLRKRIEFLQHGQREFPQDFWINHELAQSLKRETGMRYVEHPEHKKKLINDATRFYAVAAVLRPNNFKVLLNYGAGLQISGRFQEALDVWRKAEKLNPEYAEIHYDIGVALLSLGDKVGARNAFTKSIECRADFSKAHYNKAFVNQQLGNLTEAGEGYKKAVELDGKYCLNSLGLGTWRYRQGDVDGAIEDFKKAIELHPRFQEAYSSLGGSWYVKSLSSPESKAKCLSEALFASRKAVVLNPGDGGSYATISLALTEQGEFDAALRASEMAIYLKPDEPMAHRARALALSQQGNLVEATTALERAMTLCPPDEAEWRRADEQRRKILEELLAAWRHGEKTSAAELLLLADYCRNDKKEPQTAAVLCQMAFAAQPSLAADVEKRHRYNAACCAVLAGAKDWRSKAHDWLRADLSAWRERLSNEPLSAPDVKERLAQWEADERLQSVRAAEALASLVEPQRQRWVQLWNDVSELKFSASAGYREIAAISDGRLSLDDARTTLNVKLSADKTYVVEMTSTELNPFLYLEDPQGRVLKLNDDVTIGTNHNSRLVFAPAQDGNYRIVAAAISPKNAGSFSLTVREHNAVSVAPGGNASDKTTAAAFKAARFML